tara:strand:+ start:21783 stop:22463 length:681 start_codon:yes stop_codon:yes gene_type:complete
VIDIIMPAYLPTENHHKLLLRAILSLENQTYKDFSVIIVLNGCYTDYDIIKNSIKTSLDITWLTIEGKASGAIARNTGIYHSTKKYIAQLDADDQYHPRKLEKQIKFFNSYPEYSFVGALANDFMSSTDIKNSCFSKHQYRNHFDIARALQKSNIMCHGSIMFKRKVFIDMGGYNEKNKPGDVWPEYGARMWEDWDLWKRSIQQGHKFYNMPERLYYWSTNTGVER